MERKLPTLKPLKCVSSNRWVAGEICARAHRRYQPAAVVRSNEPGAASSTHLSLKARSRVDTRPVADDLKAPIVCKVQHARVCVNLGPLCYPPPRPSDTAGHDLLISYNMRIGCVCATMCNMCTCGDLGRQRCYATAPHPTAAACASVSSENQLVTHPPQANTHEEHQNAKAAYQRASKRLRVDRLGQTAPNCLCQQTRACARRKSASVLR